MLEYTDGQTKVPYPSSAHPSQALARGAAVVIADLDGDVLASPAPSPLLPDELSAHQLVGRGVEALRLGDPETALREFGLALVLEPGLPRAQLGAAQALDALGLDQRARAILASDRLAERLDLDGLLIATEIAGRRYWRDVAIPMLVQAYLMQPSPEDLDCLNSLATPVLDGIVPAVTVTLPRESRPVQVPVVGRNELCPCGSGKKYKRCCMRRNLETPRPASRSDVDNTHALALVEEQDEHFDTARQLWERLTDRYPATPVYWYRLGIVRTKLHLYREAIAAFDHMDRLTDRKQDFPVEEWALALDRAGRHRDALRVLDRHPRSSFTSASTLALRAEILRHLNRLSEARDALLSACHLEPTNLEYLVALADVHQALGEVEQAAQVAASALSAGLERQPTDDNRDSWVDQMLGAAAVLVGLGYNSDKVLDASALLLKSTRNPDLRAQAMAVRAHSLLTLQRAGEAASAVEEALAAGESLDLYLVGAAAAGQLGDHEARASYLRDAVRLIDAEMLNQRRLAFEPVG